MNPPGHYHLRQAVESKWGEDGKPKKIGSYEISGNLEESMRKAIYAVLDTGTGEKLVLKIQRTIDTSSQADFEREIRYANRINHPNVIKLSGHGVVKTPGDDFCHFMVMERFEGDLSYISIPKTISERELLKLITPFLLQFALGLDGIHAEGLLHLDAKPDNVLVSTEGGNLRAVIADLESVRDQKVKIRIGQDFPMGTLVFMSPEHTAGFLTFAPDTPSDWFSFAASWYSIILEECLLHQLKDDVGAYREEMTRYWLHHGGKGEKQREWNAKLEQRGLTRLFREFLVRLLHSRAEERLFPNEKVIDTLRNVIDMEGHPNPVKRFFMRIVGANLGASA